LTATGQAQRDEARVAHLHGIQARERRPASRDLTPDRPELASRPRRHPRGAIHLLAASRLADLGLAAPQLGGSWTQFAASGAVLAFVIDPIDPMTPDRRRLAPFLADAVEAQRRVQAERQRDGLDRACGRRQEGRRSARRASASD
jgi:hypothetical protein